MPFIYPTAAEFSEIEQELITEGRTGRVGFDILPVETADTFKIRWAQKDNYYGLQQLRGLDGAPSKVQRIGTKVFEYEPGVFGEYEVVTETELSTRAENLNMLTANIKIGDIIGEIDRQLLGRENDRMEASIWTLLTTGTISISLAGSAAGIGYLDTYTLQTYSPTGWASGSATPILDFQYVQQHGEASGISVNFGIGAKAYMNGFTANLLINNGNAADLDGRRGMYGATLNNMKDIANYFAGQGLAEPVVYDRGYQATTVKQSSFTKFIPNNKVVFVGQRPNNAAVGNYKMCRNMVNGGTPGSYRFIKDTYQPTNAPKQVPPSIEVHRGHNGGPTIYYPSAVLVMTVG